MDKKSMRSISIVVNFAIVCLMITSTFVVMASKDSRTGQLGNEPVSGYSEGSEIFKIHHGNGIHNTNFDLGETVTVKIVSDKVPDLQKKNKLKVFDWQKNILMDLDPAFTVTDSTPPTYSYEATFDVTTGNGFTNDHYLVEIDLQANNGKRFQTWDTIIVGGGATTPKYIKTYTDPNYSHMDWVFNTNEVVYIEVWTGGATPDVGNSGLEFANYMNDNDNIQLDETQNTNIVMNGQYSRFAYNLATDLDTQKVAVNEGWWYTIQVDLRDDQDGNIIRSWTIQIYINIEPTISTVWTAPSSVDVIGTSSTSIYSLFTDLDAPTANSFVITMEVRGPDDITSVRLLDAQTNGQGGLTIMDLGGGEYNASYSWNPAESLATGLYDISVIVIDNDRGSVTDGFNKNSNELNVFNSNYSPPELFAGSTYANPSTVTLAGTASTTIYNDFTDPDDPVVSTFYVSFWIRDPVNNVIILADSKANGGTGNLGGTVEIIRKVAGEFTASIYFDPDNTISTGKYDLYFEVVDSDGGTAIDSFDNNQNELEITSGDNEPEIIDVVVTPGTVDKVGENLVTFFGTFTDSDNHAIDSYLVTLEVRNNIGDKIKIARDIEHGGIGEFGATLSLSKTDEVYTASISWDPADTVTVGYYDLRMEVEDPNENKADDKFEDNPDELQVVSSNNPPTLMVGSTWADPNSVVRTGSSTTTLYADFTDLDNPSVSSLRVTFKVRDMYNNEIVIVDDKFRGEVGEFGGTVEINGAEGAYSVSIEWDPPETIAVGTFDIYFCISDSFNDKAEDVYSNNLEELMISVGQAPVITKLVAAPAIVSVWQNDTTTIYAEFTDADAVDATEFNVTFKVRDPIGNEIALVDDVASGSAGLFKNLLQIEKIGGIFNASIEWDPPQIMVSGLYDLEVEIVDSTILRSKSDFGLNPDRLELTGGVSPGNPTLIPSIPSNTDNDYTFIVTYVDLENDEPDDKGVRLIIDGNDYRMTGFDDQDKVFTDGKKYFYVLSLDEGIHDFHFTVSDTSGLSSSTEPESLDVTSGGGHGDSKAKGSSILWWIIAIVAMVLVTIVILIIMARRRSPFLRQMKKTLGISEKYNPDQEPWAEI